MKKEAVEITRANSKKVKIFISPVIETIDINTGKIDSDFESTNLETWLIEHRTLF